LRRPAREPVKIERLHRRGAQLKSLRAGKETFAELAMKWLSCIDARRSCKPTPG
jgi:hypothetical protein